jgi:ketosteroid isomerase-like protein
MKLKFLFPMILIFAVSAFAQNSDESSLRRLVKSMTDAQIAYDAKTLDSILTADYIEISPLGEFDPREKVIGFYSPEAKAQAAGMSISVEPTDFSIRSYGKFAIVITQLNYKMSAGGKDLPPRAVRVTYVMRKDGKAWKIASAHYTGIRPPQTPPKQ